MAAGYAAQTAAALDQTFAAQVRGAIVKAAEDIYSEGAGVAGHPARASLATRVLNSPDAFIAPFSAAVAAQGVDKASTDTAISSQVAAVWNALAGA